MARWLQNKPQILILNGPTVGVDIGAKFDIHELLRELARSGMAIIIISDDLREVKNVCSRVLVMREGEIRESFRLDEMDEEQIAKLDLMGH